MKSYLARRIDNLEAQAVPSSLDYLIVCSESDITTRPRWFRHHYRRSARVELRRERSLRVVKDEQEDSAV